MEDVSNAGFFDLTIFGYRSSIGRVTIMISVAIRGLLICVVQYKRRDAKV